MAAGTTEVTMPPLVDYSPLRTQATQTCVNTQETFTVFIPDDPYDPYTEIPHNEARSASVEQSHSDSATPSESSHLIDSRTSPLSSPHRQSLHNQISADANYMITCQRPPLSTQASKAMDGVYLRYMRPYDLDGVKDVCSNAFPLDYPEYWYKDITHNERLFAIAAVVPNYQTVLDANGHPMRTRIEHVVGILVAETKTLGSVNLEDHEILDRTLFDDTTLVSYILSVGVLRSYRNRGIGTRLLDEYMYSVVQSKPRLIRCVYLHVLHSNIHAIHFYERHRFIAHTRLRNYYRIHGELEDAFTYVLYVNGGSARCTVSVFLVNLLACCCSPVKHLLRVGAFVVQGIIRI